MSARSAQAGTERMATLRALELELEERGHVIAALRAALDADLSAISQPRRSAPSAPERPLSETAANDAGASRQRVDETAGGEHDVRSTPNNGVKAHAPSETIISDDETSALADAAANANANAVAARALNNGPDRDRLAPFHDDPHQRGPHHPARADDEALSPRPPPAEPAATVDAAPTDAAAPLKTTAARTARDAHTTSADAPTAATRQQAQAKRPFVHHRVIQLLPDTFIV